MNIVDITNAYIEYLSHNDLKKYESEYPSLFKHYFQYWGDRELFGRPINKKDVLYRVKLIKKHLPEIKNSIYKHELNAYKIKIVIFVGQGCTNGHAFYDENSFVVWIPVEMYTTKIQVIAFLTHEIIHSLHYQKNPEYYFNNKQEKDDQFRQLVTEGIATYVSKKIMDLTPGEALWADFLSIEEISNWMMRCDDNKKEICEKIRDKNLETRLFEANDPSDIYNFRSGYYLALKITESIAKKQKLTTKELIDLSKDKTDQLFREEMDKCGN